MTSSSSSNENMLLVELRMKDESLTKEMYENPSDPDSILNVLMKKLQLYNDIEFALTEPRNKILVGFMKIPVENRILITQIKKDYFILSRYTIFYFIFLSYSPYFNIDLVGKAFQPI